MTDQQKIKALAEKAMGWKQATGLEACIPDAHFDAHQGLIMIQPSWEQIEWNPLTNSSDCAALRERIYERIKDRPGFGILSMTGIESTAIVSFALKLWMIE